MRPLGRARFSVSLGESEAAAQNERLSLAATTPARRRRYRLRRFKVALNQAERLGGSRWRTKENPTRGVTHVPRSGLVTSLPFEEVMS